MRKLLFMCAIMPILLSFRTSEVVHPEVSKEIPAELFVSARGGLNMRERPDSKSARIITIPDGGMVTVLDRVMVKETIGGHEGNWIKVHYAGKEGYAYDRFLINEPKSMPRQGCTPFMWDRRICMPGGEMRDVAKRAGITDQTREHVLSPGLFKTPPPVESGSRVFVITRKGIVGDSIKSLTLGWDEALGVEPELHFDLQNDHPADFICLDYADHQRHRATPPEMMKCSPVNDSGLMERYLRTYLEIQSLPLSIHQETKDLTVLKKHYSMKLFNVTHPSVHKKIEFVELRYHNKSDMFEFLLIFIDGHMAYGNYGKMRAHFVYRSTPYILMRVTEPSTCRDALVLYQAKDNTLESVSIF